jgi:hypothetical protein
MIVVAQADSAVPIDRRVMIQRSRVPSVAGGEARSKLMVKRRANDFVGHLIGLRVSTPPWRGWLPIAR